MLNCYLGVAKQQVGVKPVSCGCAHSDIGAVEFLHLKLKFLGKNRVDQTVAAQPVTQAKLRRQKWAVLLAHATINSAYLSIFKALLGNLHSG